MTQSPRDNSSRALTPMTISQSEFAPCCGGLSGNTALFAIVLSGLFGWMSHFPLWHTDLWGHLQYGEIICREKGIPATEPIMPLSADVPFVDPAWLSQVIAFAVFAYAGVGGLQCLYAGCVTLGCGLMLWICCHNCRRGVVISLAAVAVMLALSWHHLPVIRPQAAGVVCFLALLACLTSRGNGWWRFVGVPLLMIVWANLHGSFIMGLGLLGCFAAGRAIDVLRRTKRCGAACRDGRTRSFLVLTSLAGTAVLINPYGVTLYEYVLTFGKNPNLRDLTEWHALAISTAQGQRFAVAVIALLPILYWSPRRVSATEVLLLAGLGGSTVWTSRMIVWFAPIAAYVFALHGGAWWLRTRFGQYRFAFERPRWLWALMALAACSIAVAVSPMGRAAWSGQEADVRASVSQQTPVAAAEYLITHPPRGAMFNTYEWGDYLSWVGSQQGQRWPIFVASHAHLVPRSVWRDYMALIGAPANWETRLDRYDVETVVIDQRYRSALISRLRQNQRWTLVFEDDVAAIFVRQR